ncbi:transposase [Acetobacter thailandicus]|uniref:transposase n=2 Tax=Acetobacter thailandicus TaxID=1502842 RepID=UPI0038993AB8
MICLWDKEAGRTGMARGDLTDHEWAMIGPLLLPECGRWARPAEDNRRFLNGILYILCTGCLWPDMHERYGKWNLVYVWFRRWAEQGVVGCPAANLGRPQPDR